VIAAPVAPEQLVISSRSAALIIPRPWVENQAFLDFRQNILSRLDGLTFFMREFDPEHFFL